MLGDRNPSNSKKRSAEQSFGSVAASNKDIQTKTAQGTSVNTQIANPNTMDTFQKITGCTYHDVCRDFAKEQPASASYAASKRRRTPTAFETHPDRENKFRNRFPGMQNIFPQVFEVRIGWGGERVGRANVFNLFTHTHR